MIERVLAGHGFNAAEVSEWCDEISGETVAALAAQHPGYRFAGKWVGGLVIGDVCDEAGWPLVGFEID